jgi:hypothetical protein
MIDDTSRAGAAMTPFRGKLSLEGEVILPSISGHYEPGGPAACRGFFRTTLVDSVKLRMAGPFHLEIERGLEFDIDLEGSTFGPDGAIETWAFKSNGLIKRR